MNEKRSKKDQYEMSTSMGQKHGAPHKRCDVIIVMGAAVWKGGQASPALRRRVRHAVDLFKKHKAPYLLVTGGIVTHPPAEATLMKELAMEAGIPPECILVEEKGTSTLTNVVESVRILRKRHWTHAIVVTDPYHLFRSLFVFRCFGIKVTGSGAQGGKEENPVWRWWYYYCREFIALLWYYVLIKTGRVSLKGRTIEA